MENIGLEQAKAELESILSLVKALNVDYERLKELQENEEELDEDEQEELETMELAVKCYPHTTHGYFMSRDEVIDVIRGSAYVVQVRSAWQDVGKELTSLEFMILLAGGGPEVRIKGELDVFKEPSVAWIEYRSWGEPWQELPVSGEEQQAINTFCQQFWFGE